MSNPAQVDSYALKLIEIGIMIFGISGLGYLAWRPEGLVFHRERQAVPQTPGPITRGSLIGCRFSRHALWALALGNLAFRVGATHGHRSHNVRIERLGI
jgi:hypothetical protein